MQVSTGTSTQAGSDDHTLLIAMVTIAVAIAVVAAFFVWFCMFREAKLSLHQQAALDRAMKKCDGDGDALFAL